MKPTFLFLDDDAFHPDKIRNPEIYYPLIGADDILQKMQGYDVVTFISVEDAQEHINKNGCPSFISFDNDLQREIEGVHLAQWLVEKDLDNPGFIPDDFEYFVHSQNPIAKKRIYSYLNQYLESREPAPKKPKM